MLDSCFDDGFHFRLLWLLLLIHVVLSFPARQPLDRRALACYATTLACLLYAARIVRLLCGRCLSFELNNSARVTVSSVQTSAHALGSAASNAHMCTRVGTPVLYSILA